MMENGQKKWKKNFDKHQHHKDFSDDNVVVVVV